MIKVNGRVREWKKDFTVDLLLKNINIPFL